MPGTTDESFFEGEIERLRKLALEQGQRVGDSERERLRELHWLRCAKCGMQMETVMYAGLQLERCFHCGGTYTDQAELEKIARESSPLVHGLVARLRGPDARTSSGNWTLGEQPAQTQRTMSDGFGDFDDGALLPRPRRRSDEEGSSWAGLAVVALLLLVGIAYLLLFQRPSAERDLADASPAPAAVDSIAAIPAAPPPPPSAPWPPEAEDLVPPAVPADPVPADPVPADPVPADPPPPSPSAAPPPKARDGAAAAGAPAAPAAATAAAPGDDDAAPDTFDAHLGAGRKALMRGQASKAMHHYEEAARRKQGSAEALTGMGWAYVNLKEPHVAVVKFRQALVADSGHGDAYIGLGKAFRMMGKPGDAADAYRRYLDRHPSGPSATIAKNALGSLTP